VGRLVVTSGEFPTPVSRFFSKSFGGFLLLSYSCCKYLWISSAPVLLSLIIIVVRMQVGRPSNMPQCQPVIERLREEANKYHRIYVTSIHPDLCESDLRT